MSAKYPNHCHWMLAVGLDHRSFFFQVSLDNYLNLRCCCCSCKISVVIAFRF